jgi:hypothetical protein
MMQLSKLENRAVTGKANTKMQQRQNRLNKVRKKMAVRGNAFG